MASPNPNSQFEIGPPADYVGGHIAIGVVTFLEAAVPVILYYAWQKKKLDDDTMNTWYSNSWKSMTYGGFISFIVPFLFWCMSFAKNDIFSYLYVAMLLVFGGLYGSFVTAHTNIFLFRAIRWY